MNKEYRIKVDGKCFFRGTMNECIEHGDALLHRDIDYVIEEVREK